MKFWCIIFLNVFGILLASGLLPADLAFANGCPANVASTCVPPEAASVPDFGDGTNYNCVLNNALAPRSQLPEIGGICWDNTCTTCSATEKQIPFNFNGVTKKTLPHTINDVGFWCDPTTVPALTCPGQECSSTASSPALGDKVGPLICCSPVSCASQGKTCGTIDDLCGNPINCGTCNAATQFCASNNICQLDPPEIREAVFTIDNTRPNNQCATNYPGSASIAFTIFNGQACSYSGSSGDWGPNCNSPTSFNVSWTPGNDECAGSSGLETLQVCNTSNGVTACASQNYCAAYGQYCADGAVGACPQAEGNCADPFTCTLGMALPAHATACAMTGTQISDGSYSNVASCPAGNSTCTFTCNALHVWDPVKKLCVINGGWGGTTTSGYAAGRAACPGGCENNFTKLNKTCNNPTPADGGNGCPVDAGYSCITADPSGTGCDAEQEACPVVVGSHAQNYFYASGEVTSTWTCDASEASCSPTCNPAAAPNPDCSYTGCAPIVAGQTDDCTQQSNSCSCYWGQFGSECKDICGNLDGPTTSCSGCAGASCGSTSYCSGYSSDGHGGCCVNKDACGYCNSGGPSSCSGPDYECSGDTCNCIAATSPGCSCGVTKDACNVCGGIQSTPCAVNYGCGGTGGDTCVCTAATSSGCSCGVTKDTCGDCGGSATGCIENLCSKSGTDKCCAATSFDSYGHCCDGPGDHVDDCAVCNGGVTCTFSAGQNWTNCTGSNHDTCPSCSPTANCAGKTGICIDDGCGGWCSQSTCVALNGGTCLVGGGCDCGVGQCACLNNGGEAGTLGCGGAALCVPWSHAGCNACTQREVDACS